MAGDAVRVPDPTTLDASAKASEDSCAVQVAVHIRPLIDNELQNGCQETLGVEPGTSQVIKSRDAHRPSQALLTGHHCYESMQSTSLTQFDHDQSQRWPWKYGTLATDSR